MSRNLSKVYEQRASAWARCMYVYIFVISSKISRGKTACNLALNMVEGLMLLEHANRKAFLCSKCGYLWCAMTCTSLYTYTLPVWCTYKKFFLRMRVCVSLTNVWIDVKLLQGESGGMGNFTMTNWEHFQFTLTPSGSPALGSGDATSTVDEITNRMYLKNESKPRMGKRKPIKMRPKIMINQHNSQLWISISFIRGWFSRHFRGFWGSCNQAGLLDVQTTRLGAIHIGLQKLRSSKLW